MHTTDALLYFHFYHNAIMFLSLFKAWPVLCNKHGFDENGTDQFQRKDRYLILD